MDQKGLFIVMAKVNPEAEEAFNRWYNEDHMPKALERFPGVISGKRYQITEGEDDYRFMAMYEFESVDAMHKAVNSDAIQGLIKEFDEAFGEGGRKKVLAVQLKSLTVG